MALLTLFYWIHDLLFDVGVVLDDHVKLICNLRVVLEGLRLVPKVLDLKQRVDLLQDKLLRITQGY